MREKKEKKTKNKQDKKPMSAKKKKGLKITAIVISILIVLIILALTVIAPLTMRELLLTRDAYFDVINPIMSKKNDATNPYFNEKAQQWLVDNAENRTIVSDDNLKLHAYDLRQPQETNEYILVQHGYMRSAKYMAIIAEKFYERGYNIFLPDLRAHGESEGNYVGFGWHERLDTLKWIDLIIEQDQDAKIVLYGVSMGAATVMCTASESSLPDNVKLAVEDCGFTNAYAQYEAAAHKKHLPAWPVFPLLSDYAKDYLGYTLKDASPINAIKNCQVPMLFMHGTDDQLVPFYMMGELYDACPTDKAKFVAKGKEHVRSYQKEGYFEAIESFINKHIDD